MSGVFADNLKKERIRAGLTQADLAEILHVKKSTISLWETGTRSPDILRLIEIAKALHVSADILLGLSKDEEGLLHGYELKYGKERIKAFIEALGKLDK